MIEARGVTFGYRSAQAVVEGWDATIEDGSTASITGRSGSGKSTLLYLLGTLVRPWAGRLRIAGADVGQLSDRKRSDVRAATIGFVFQDALLDPRRSVLDNVLEGSVYRGDHRAAMARRARDLLEQVGVEVEPARRATDLSGGQAQRVAICRALLNQPPIILADEPTGNLDRANAAVIESILFQQARDGAVVVIATHDEAMAGRCDQTFRL